MQRWSLHGEVLPLCAAMESPLGPVLRLHAVMESPWFGAAFNVRRWSLRSLVLPLRAAMESLWSGLREVTHCYRFILT